MNGRPVVSVLVGLQAAGKSIVARTMLPTRTVVVSKGELPERAPGGDVVVDNTNASVARWAPISHATRAPGALK